MIKIKNDCVGCRDIGLPCQGSDCPNRSVKHLYCDKCNDEVDMLRNVYCKEICEDCLLKMFETEHLVCEKCKFNADELFVVDDVKMCEDCLTEYFPKVTEECV